MSRQNKARQKAIIAKQITELHKQGQRGPKATTPKHGKVRTLRELERLARIAAAEKAATANTPAAKPANGRRTTKSAPRSK